MRGCIKRRYKKAGTWSIIVDIGRVPVLDPETKQPLMDPVTGEVKTKRKQKWITVKGTKEQAETPPGPRGVRPKFGATNYSR